VIARIRKRTILVAALAGAALAALGVSAAWSHAAGAPAELAVSNVYTHAGYLTPLKQGVTYAASSVPVPLRLTAPDGSWAGSQWKTTLRGKPAFGWVAVGHGATAPSGVPLHGVVTIVVPYGASGGVTQTVKRLRTGGSGVTFEQTSAVRLAGYEGEQFDGNVWGKWGHVFIPFTAVTHGASPPDNHKLGKGEAFRVIVLDVRGRTVVVFLENADLPAEQFAGFLGDAGRLLKTLAFPA
jgi:hypothetical protein